ncbi:MAG: SDR family oxidoreductase [Saprospiraceae bacterium]|nr:SDR family oxidoreductase [Saprospiraceae bacterium]
MEKKLAIITGSSTGVGSATAMQLASTGHWNVVINYANSANEAEATMTSCQALGAEVLCIQADVSEDLQCRDLVKQSIAKFGRIDALINNAGTTKFCEFSDLEGLDKSDFLNLYSVNVVGAYQMARAACPHLRTAGGAIVNIASIAALTGLGSSIAYAASKGAMVTLTLSMAHAFAPEVRVNAVCPGFIQGRWTKGFLGDRYEEMKAGIEKSAALKVTATNEDIAESIVYLATQAKIMTGEIMIVDGGATLKQVTMGRR